MQIWTPRGGSTNSFRVIFDVFIGPPAINLEAIFYNAHDKNRPFGILSSRVVVLGTTRRDGNDKRGIATGSRNATLANRSSWLRSIFVVDWWNSFDIRLPKNVGDGFSAIRSSAEFKFIWESHLKCFISRAENPEAKFAHGSALNRQQRVVRKLKFKKEKIENNKKRWQSVKLSR